MLPFSLCIQSCVTPQITSTLPIIATATVLTPCSCAVSTQLAQAIESVRHVHVWRRQWSYIGGSLHEKWAPASTIIRKHYLRYLLAFEQALTQEADYTLVRNDYGKRGRSSTGAADDTPRRASADGRASAGAFLDSRVKREEGKRVKREDSGYGRDRDEPKGRLKVSKPQPVRAARPVLQEASLSDGGSDMEDAGVSLVSQPRSMSLVIHVCMVYCRYFLLRKVLIHCLSRTCWQLLCWRCAVLRCAALCCCSTSSLACPTSSGAARRKLPIQIALP